MKNVFMILFVMFSMASFTLVEYQPPLEPDRTVECVIDNQFDLESIAFLAMESPVINYIIIEGVAISTGGTVNPTTIQEHGLNINKYALPIESLDIYSYCELMANQSNSILMTTDKWKGLSVVYSNSDNRYIGDTKLDSFHKTNFKKDNTYLKVDGTVNEQSCQA